jgi:hypothetical protein
MRIKSMSIGDPEFMIWENQMRNGKRDPFWKFGGVLKGSKKKLWLELKEKDWEGEECFVIGGGSSLRDFDFERLRGKGRVIVCNKGFLYMPFADMMIGMDNDFYNHLNEGKITGEKRLGLKPSEIRKRFRSFEGWKVWIDSGNYYYDGIHFVFKRTDPRVGKMIQGIYTGNNVGVGALMMACTLGCNPIYLLGFDMYHTKNTHFHNGYYRRQVQSHLNSFRKHFQRIREDIVKKEIKVYNLNPKSKLSGYEKIPMEEIIG